MAKSIELLSNLKGHPSRPSALFCLCFSMHPNGSGSLRGRLYRILTLVGASTTPVRSVVVKQGTPHPPKPQTEKRSNQLCFASELFGSLPLGKAPAYLASPKERGSRLGTGSYHLALQSTVALVDRSCGHVRYPTLRVRKPATVEEANISTDEAGDAKPRRSVRRRAAPKATKTFLGRDPSRRVDLSTGKLHKAMLA